MADTAAAESLAFAPNPQTSWVAYVTLRNGRGGLKQRLSDQQEVTVDRTELKSDISALVGSVEVAIARLQHKAHGKSVRINEYETVEADALRVLSALSEPGSNFQLGELMRQESVIRGTFSMEEDRSAGKSGDNDDDDDDDNLFKRRGRAIFSESESEGDTAIVLSRRRGRLHRAVHHHVAIRHDAATISQDSQNDLLAAITVASLVYGGPQNQEKLESFIAAKRAEMEEADRLSGASGAGATVDERIALILHEGKSIADSMGKDGSVTNARIVSAAEDIANLHLGRHKQDYAQQLAEARACLVENNDPKLLAEFDMQAKAWKRQIAKTESGLNSGLCSTRSLSCDSGAVTSEEGLLKMVAATNLSGVYAGLNGNLAESNAHLASQSKILDNPMRRLLVAEADLMGMKAGEYHGNIDAIASAAGTTREKVIQEVALYQEMHHIPPETAGELNARIGRINSLWESQMHGPRHGASVDININL